jgi:hypothetical protein
MRLELGEFRGPLAKLALSANNNLSDNALAGDLKQHRQCYLFDLRLVSCVAGAISSGDGHASRPGAKIAWLGRDRECALIF